MEQYNSPVCIRRSRTGMYESAGDDIATTIIPGTKRMHEQTTSAHAAYLHSRAQVFARRTDHRFSLDDLDRSGKICMVSLMLPGGSRTICTIYKYRVAIFAWVGCVFSVRVGFCKASHNATYTTAVGSTTYL